MVHMNKCDRCGVQGLWPRVRFDSLCTGCLEESVTRAVRAEAQRDELLAALRRCGEMATHALSEEVLEKDPGFWVDACTEIEAIAWRYTKEARKAQAAIEKAEGAE